MTARMSASLFAIDKAAGGEGAAGQVQAAASNRAREAWRAALPISGGSLAERYFRAFGIFPPFPPTLRFTPGAWHAPSRQALPAIIGLVTDGRSGDFLGVHRTYLPPEHGICASVKPAWLMLGPRGGACRLGPVSEILIITETIETGLLAMRGGDVARVALNAPNIGALDLPDAVREATIVPTSDPGFGYACTTAARWRRAYGRRTAVVPSSAYFRGGKR